MTDDSTTTISLITYAKIVLGSYPAYQTLRPGESIHLFPNYPPTNESILFVGDDLIALEMRVLEELTMLSTLPLSLLPSAIFCDWITLVTKNLALIEEVSVNTETLRYRKADMFMDGLIKKVGEGRFSFFGESPIGDTEGYYDNLDYITYAVSKAIESFHDHIDHILFENFKPLKRVLYRSVTGALTQNIEREVFSLLAKEYTVGGKRFLQLNVNQFTRAEKYFLLYKSIHRENVNLNVFDDDPSYREEDKTPYAAVLEVRKKIVTTVLEEFQNQPEEIVRFFQLILYDTIIPDSFIKLQAVSMKHTVWHMWKHSDQALSKHFSDVCVKVITDDSVGCLATKKTAIRELIDQKDTRIVSIIKELVRDENAFLYKFAKEVIHTALREMPDHFPEPEFDKEKALIKRAQAHIFRVP